MMCDASRFVQGPVTSPVASSNQSLVRLFSSFVSGSFCVWLIYKFTYKVCCKCMQRYVDRKQSVYSFFCCWFCTCYAILF